MAGRYKKGETSPHKRKEQAFKKLCIKNKLQALLDSKKDKYAFICLHQFRNHKRNKISLDSILKWTEPDCDIFPVSYGTLNKYPVLKGELESALGIYNTEVYAKKLDKTKGRRKDKRSTTGLSKDELKEKVLDVANENQMLLNNCITIYRMYMDLKSTIPEAEQNEVYYQKMLKRHAKGLKRFNLQLVVDNENE